EITFTPNW
nr:hypertrehalosemic neuropeptide, Poa-HrTH [Polyphaga aegyptiaca=cockroaches, corpus cardiacum, Peptide Partial, 8 aa] [Polyphaga aegyptiaca]